MSDLSKFIDRYCSDFKVHIEPLDHKVFIEIMHTKSFGYHNMEVAIGEEFNGLVMLMLEYNIMTQGFVLEETLN